MIFVRGVTPRPRRPPLLIRIVRARPRLFISVGVGLVVTLAAAVVTDWRVATRLLTGWDLSVALYLVLAFLLIASSDFHHIRRHAAMQDEGQLAILTCTVAAALAILAAILAELCMSTAVTSRPPGHVI